jgi:hypothetical protein
VTPRRRPPLNITAASFYRHLNGGDTVLPGRTDDPSNAVTISLPELEGMTAESLAYARNAGALAKPSRSMQHALGGFSARDAKAPAMATDGGGGERVTLLYEQVCKRFADAAAPDSASKFSGLIIDLYGVLDASPTALSSDAKRIAYGALVIDALAESSGGDPTLAKLALDRLKDGLHFTPRATAEQAQDPSIDTAAWRTAQHLAATASGYDFVRELAGRDWPDTGIGRIAPRLWLQAADQFVKETGCDADPASVSAAASRLAGDTGANTKAHAASIVRAAATLWDTGNVDGLTAADKGALLAGRQGYFTDGPGTPFAATKNRIARFLNVAIPRATSDRPALDADDGETPVPVATRRRRTSAFVRPFGYSKSAVAGMQYGVEGASHGPWDKDEKALHNATRSALAELGKGLAAQTSTDGRRWPPNDAELVVDGKAIDTLVSAVELDVLSEFPNGIEYGSRLSDEMLDRIAESVEKRIGQISPRDEPTGSRRGRIPRPFVAALDASRARLDPDSADARRYRETRVRNALDAFRARLAPGNNDPAARAGAREQIRKHLTNHSDVVDTQKIEVWRKRLPHVTTPEAQASFDTIGRVALGETIKPQGTETKDYRDAGDRIIDALEGSGKAIITDGGTVGFSTRGISASAASASWLSPRVNLRGSLGRQAVLAYTRSTADYKISFGTQHRSHVSGGGGFQMGSYVGVARLAVNMEAEHQWDDTKQSTVDLSIARRLDEQSGAYDEKRAKEQLKQVNRYLFDNAGKGKSERALWNDLGSRFLDNDDFSVALNDQTGKRRGHEAGITFRPGVRVDVGSIALRANGIVGGSHNRVYRATLDTQDKGGHARIESHRFGQGQRAILQAGVNFTVSTPLYGAPQRGSSDPTDIGSASVFTPNIVSVEAQLRDDFQQAKATLVREGGKLQVRSSNADTEFASFEDYKRVLSDDPAWLLAFGTKLGEPMPTTKEEIESALKVGRDKLEKYLSHLSANTAPTLRYIARRRLREHAATTIDLLYDRIASLKGRNRDSEVDEIEDLQKQRDELLQRQDSWLPTELLTVQVTERQSAVGLRLGLQLGTQRGARGEHEVTSLKLKPGQADQLDSVWPRMA